LQEGARHAARDMLQLDGKVLTELMESLTCDAAGELTYIRGKLKVRADSPKGRSARTLVEWYKAKGMAMARAKAIAALADHSKAPTYEQMLRELTAGEWGAGVGDGRKMGELTRGRLPLEAALHCDFTPHYHASKSRCDGPPF